MGDLSIQSASADFKGIEHVARFLTEQVRGVTEEVSLDSSQITSLSREKFRSETLEESRLHLLEGAEQADGFLFTITNKDGSCLFLIIGKVADPGNPFEVGDGTVKGALDLRKSQAVLYSCDGKERINEYAAGHKPNVYQGEGYVKILLSCIRQSLGKSLGVEKFS